MTSAMKKRQRRKTRSYRAASLKGARVKRRMQLTKLTIGDLTLEVVSRKPNRTIDLVPKVEWP